MYQIIIESSAGITFDNLPSEALSLISGINDGQNCLQLSFMYSEATERAKNILSASFDSLRFTRNTSGDAYICSRQRALPDVVERITEQAVPETTDRELRPRRTPLTLPGIDTLTGRGLPPNIDGEISAAARASGWDNVYNQNRTTVIGGGADRFDGALEVLRQWTLVQAAPTPPAPVAEAMERLTRPPMVTVNIEQQPQEEEEEEEVNGTGIVPVANCVLPGEVPTEQIPIEIAKTLRNNVSTQAGMVSSKLAELDKIMKRSLILQNEINLLMKPVVENEKVQRIKAQIEQLNSYGGDIKKVYIAADTSDLIILTNRLRSDPITDERGRTQIFDIGEMQINLSLMLLLCETDPGSTAGRPVRIKNLTHQYCINNGNGNSKWECGHVREGEICFGNVFAQIHQALIAKNIILVVELIIRFIKNPDPNDAWGSKILNFPKIGGGV
jgi:hypothetical protein